ncbi:24714_t:CDS:2, partial [Gigaspora rosea]
DKIRASFPVKVEENGAEFSTFIKLTPLQSTINKIYKDKYVKWRLTKVKRLNKISSIICFHIVKLKNIKKTYFDAVHIYVARTPEETTWFSIQTTPPPEPSLAFQRIQNWKKLDFEHVREPTDIADESLGNRETVSQNNSGGDQMPEIIEISTRYPK